MTGAKDLADKHRYVFHLSGFRLNLKQFPLQNFLLYFPIQLK